ncbi:secreted salivary gland peptide, putative, partial [Ixodes scapularis]
GYIFDFQDVVYDFLVTRCAVDELVSIFDVDGDSKDRGATGDAKKLADRYFALLTFKISRYVIFGCTNNDCLSRVVCLFAHCSKQWAEAKAHISEQIEQEDEYMWTVTSGAELSAKVSFKIEVPLVYSFSSEFSTTLKTSSGSTTVEARTTRQLIKQDVIIPPEATIEAKWLVNKAQVEIPWEANISMKGYVAALFHSPSALTWKYFNVTEIKHEQLTNEGDSVIFQAKGLFKAKVAQSYHLSTSQTELAPYDDSMVKYASS